MNILKITVQMIALFIFVISALIVREDAMNECKWSTVLLCISMAALMTMN